MNLIKRLMTRARFARTDNQQSAGVPAPRMESLENRLLMTNDKTLWGYVFCDADNDGFRDPGEKGIANVTINIRNGINTVNKTTKTDANGFYKFTQLIPGKYMVTETQPVGLQDGKEQLGRVYDDVTGLETGSRGIAGNNVFTDIRLPSGNPVTGKNYNFGEICSPPEITGNEGLTPGFWKNHTAQWKGFSPSQTLESVFNVPDSLGLDNKTLLQALSFSGGSGVQGAAQNLFRHAVAAILNASHPLVDYPITTSSIISQVNTALASGDKLKIEALKNKLDQYNNLGGGIDAHGRPI